MKTMQEAIEARIKEKQEEDRKLREENEHARQELKARESQAADDFKDWLARAFCTDFSELDVQAQEHDEKRFYITVKVEGGHIDVNALFVSGVRDPHLAPYNENDPIWIAYRQERREHTRANYFNFLDALIYAMGIDWKEK